MNDIPYFKDQNEVPKTDVLKDWMQHRDMASFSSSCYSSSPQQPSSSSPSFDNNGQAQQQYSPREQHQSSLSSLESFLFLPQLPVDGDDCEDDAWQFLRHNHQRQSNQQKQQFSSCLLTIANPPTNSSSSRITGTTTTTTNTPYKNAAEDNHETKCNKQIFSNKSDDMISNRSRSPFCGGKLCNSSNSLFPYTAANSTVIAAFPSNHSNNDDDADDNVAVNSKKSQQRNIPSSLNILISKNSSGGINNSSHNHSHSPACLTANHHHLHQKDKSLHFHERCHPQLPQQYHLRHFVRRRLYIFRICQALSILLCMLFLFNLVKNSIWAEDEYKNSDSIPSSLSPPLSSKLQNRLIQSWNMPSIISRSPLLSSSSSSSTFHIPEILSVGSSTSHNEDHADDDDDTNMHNLMLLDVPNFRFLLNNKTKCNIPRDDYNYFGRGGGYDDDVKTTTTNSHKGNSASTIFFMIIVHSAPQNFEERQAIRETWGSLQHLGQFQIRIVFLLGHELNSVGNDDDHRYHHDHKSSNNNNISSNNSAVADEKSDNGNRFYSKLLQESQQHGDIVAGNFNDSYRHLTVKHLAAYLWVLNHCSHAKYILKADDDAFIDIFQLFEFLLRTFGKDPEAALICNVFPEGTKPVRGTDVLGKKWAVTYEEYPNKEYPKYCGGLAYLATPNVIREIYRMSRKVGNKYLWIDDVYVTGILRELAHVEPFYLNLRYLYDPEEYRKWLSNSVKKSYGDDRKNDKDTSSNRSGEINNHNEMQDRKSGRVGVAATAEADALSVRMNNERFSSPPQKIPFMIVHLERGSQLGREMRELWNKTVTVWSQSGLLN